MIYLLLMAASLGFLIGIFEEKNAFQHNCKQQKMIKAPFELLKTTVEKRKAIVPRTQFIEYQFYWNFGFIGLKMRKSEKAKSNKVHGES